jgi:hypothetical protein
VPHFSRSLREVGPFHTHQLVAAVGLEPTTYGL